MFNRTAGAESVATCVEKIIIPKLNVATMPQVQIISGNNNTLSEKYQGGARKVSAGRSSRMPRNAVARRASAKNK
jgi:hypothetical protein